MPTISSLMMLVGPSIVFTSVALACESHRFSASVRSRKVESQECSTGTDVSREATKSRHQQHGEGVDQLFMNNARYAAENRAPDQNRPAPPSLVE